MKTVSYKIVFKPLVFYSVLSRTSLVHNIHINNIGFLKINFEEERTKYPLQLINQKYVHFVC